METEIFEKVRERLARPGLGEGETFSGELVSLRKDFPGLRFVKVSSRDVEDPPFLSLEAVDLHLIDVRDHCLRLTGEVNLAGGILVAVRPGIGTEKLKRTIEAEPGVR